MNGTGGPSPVPFHASGFGAAVDLPEPFGLTLDTGEFPAK